MSVELVEFTFDDDVVEQPPTHDLVIGDEVKFLDWDEWEDDFGICPDHFAKEYSYNTIYKVVQVYEDVIHVDPDPAGYGFLACHVFKVTKPKVKLPEDLFEI